MYIPSKDDLRMVPIDMLINEIKNRHSGGLILAMNIDDPSQPDRDWQIITDGNFSDIWLLKEYLDRLLSYDLDSNLGFAQSQEMDD